MRKCVNRNGDVRKRTRAEHGLSPRGSNGDRNAAYMLQAYLRLELCSNEQHACLLLDLRQRLKLPNLRQFNQVRCSPRN
jgi:hypothetical protein